MIGLHGEVVNMRYYKIINNNYIIAIGTGNGGTEITELEYNEIMSVIQNRPQPTETTAYRLKDDLTWESYEVEPISDEDSEPTEEERLDAYDILMGLKE